MSDRPEHPAAHLSAEEAAVLAEANVSGLRALHQYVGKGDAVAFLGAGASAPLYPLWQELIDQLIDRAHELGMTDAVAATCRSRAATKPDAVVELIRRQLGSAGYHEAARDVFRIRHDLDTGRSWTLTHELVCRASFRGIVTTNYDPGILDARMRIRPHASGTGFTSWRDELKLDRWSTGDIFDDDELPILFAHGQHDQPDSMVLATSDYRRAYSTKLSDVMSSLIRGAHLVWIGFSFTDERIASVLDAVAEASGTRIDPGVAPRHVAVMPWDPASGDDPQTLRTLAQIDLGAHLVLYPARSADHSSLHACLRDLPAAADAVDAGDGRRRAGTTTPLLRDGPRSPHTPRESGGVPARWHHGQEAARSFTGRADEIALLDGWASEPSVRVVAVTAWGGAGKTALVTHWIENHGGANRRPRVQGVFAWSFYADPDVEQWAREVATWASEELGLRVTYRGHPIEGVKALVRTGRVLLVLDGLEVVQDGPGSDSFGRLLDGRFRDLLTLACRVEHDSLIVLTSRFPFADILRYDGSSLRTLEVRPLTLAEGAELLCAADPNALDDHQRRQLVAEVEGHALAVATMATLLAERPTPVTGLELRAELGRSRRVQEKVTRVLGFYADRLPTAQRYLAAAVSMFARPVTPTDVLAVAQHEAFHGHLSTWNADDVEAAIRGPLAGLMTWHQNGTVTTHPLVRQTFRRLALDAAGTVASATLSGTPSGAVTDRHQAGLVVEAVELLVEAEQWVAANDLYRTRTDDGRAWLRLPAASLGRRAASLFVGSPARRAACRDGLGTSLESMYLNEAGLCALYMGDLPAAEEYFGEAVQVRRDDDAGEVLWSIKQTRSTCLVRGGRASRGYDLAREALAEIRTDRSQAVGRGHGFVAIAAQAAGRTTDAERHFVAAERFRTAGSLPTAAIDSMGVLAWAAFLARTDRAVPAERLARRNLRTAEDNGWRIVGARTRILLIRIALDAGVAETSDATLTEIIECVREGDFAVELPEVLTVAADHARHRGDLDGAADYISEAVNAATARELLPARASALVSQARIQADLSRISGDPGLRRSADDVAEAALRLCGGGNSMPWRELDALDAMAALAVDAGTRAGWTRRHRALRARLVPELLDPDPERTIAEEQGRDV